MWCACVCIHEGNRVQSQHTSGNKRGSDVYGYGSDWIIITWQVLAPPCTLQSGVFSRTSLDSMTSIYDECLLQAIVINEAFTQ